MKKGLFSILAGALLVVGCQNYDDQFSNIESQITALASQVAGLSQVQSDLTALAGTVNSLQTSVAQTVDTALADGLADIDTAVASLEAATATAASSEDVAAIAASLALQATDLDELLANSSVFTGDVVINNASTLDAFYAMGSTLAIVNGYVDIDVTTAMDIVKVQAVVNQILTTTKQFDYKATAKAVTKVTFNNLSGTQTLTVEQAGAYMFKSLVSAGTITLKDTYVADVDTIDFRNLTTLTSVTDGTTANSLDFAYANEIHLTKIAYYPTSLTVKCKTGGVIDLSAISDTTIAGIVQPVSLTIGGPSSFTATGIKGDAYSASAKGAMSFTDVNTISIDNFGGTVTIGAGVLTASISKAATQPVITAAVDLVTLTVEGVTDYGKSYDILNAANKAKTLYTSAMIDLDVTSANNDLTTLNLSGTFDAVDIAGASSLKTIVAAGTYNSLDVDSNGDLTSITTPAAKINSFTLDNNDDLLTTALDFSAYTTVQAGTTADPVDSKREVLVTGNAKLNSLTVHADKLYSLTVSTNPKLTAMSFPFLTTLDGAATDKAPVLSIKGNKLTAATATDNYDQTAAGAAIASTVHTAVNTGAYAAANPLTSLKAWADLAIAVVGRTTTLEAWFDKITEVSTLDVNGVVTTTTPVNTTQDATKATTLFAAIYSRPVVTAVSTMDGAIAGETKTFTFDLGRDGLGNANNLASGEGFTLTYATGLTIDFAQSTARTTVQSLITYMNADTSLASANLNIDAAMDARKKGVYTISYLSISNSLNSAGAVSVAGNIKAQFGNDKNGTPRYIIIAAAAGDSADNIANDIAFAISSTSNGTEYTATSVTTGVNAYKQFTIQRNTSGTTTADNSPLSAALPSLNFVIDVAQTSTTAVLGSNIVGYRTTSFLSNTFTTSRYSLPNVSPVNQTNLRVTLRSTNGLAMNAAVTLTAQGAISNTAILMPGNAASHTNLGSKLIPQLLVDGVSIASAASDPSSGTTDSTAPSFYVASGAAVGTSNVQTAGVTVISTDRTGWL